MTPKLVSMPPNCYFPPPMLPLQHFLQKLTRLKLGHSKGDPAPHKPILLLAVMAGIEAGEIMDNRICITPELVSRFKDLFRMLGGAFTPNFSLPFYHLRTSGFWHLQTIAGREILLTKSLSIRSFAHLKEVVAYALLDEALFLLLREQQSREVLRQALLQTYFVGRSLPGTAQHSLFAEVQEQILNEPAVRYRKKVETADEEELFVRSGVFKKVVPQVYNYTCCISGMRIIASREVQMVDACHIVPFAESHDDTITNGLSLSPNLHRAFDRHLISIDANYQVVVSNQFVEEDNSFSIRQFAGKRILLPDATRYHPHPANLQQHYQKFVQHASAGY